MRLVSYGDPGRELPGVLVGEVIVPACELLPECPASVRGILAAGLLPRLAGALSGPPNGLPAAGVRLGPPIADPSKIICIGLNYRGHALEQKAPFPERPLLFSKGPNTLSGCRDPIVLPMDDGLIDYEVELAVVIGRRCKRVAEAEAMACVAGYMVADDVSARRWQKADGQWFRAKSSDGFLPCGPALVTRDEVPDHRALRLTTRIGGELLQDALAGDLIHDIPAIIAWISREITLEAGDIISTGTPAGVGCYREPKRFLRPGDEVVCAIEGLGELRNRVQAGA